MVNKQSTDIGG